MNRREVSILDSSILRQIWAVIEETQTSVLLKLSDPDLVNQLLRQFNGTKALSSEEVSSVSAYLYSKTTLIRDLALGR
ncbi:MAG: hypothetical protein KME60_32540 [Cyanomargarita calcarea GSE-NOS-MK-12-04C]|uniref:Uncharacterized protein n=1 Tax=Cyanomargarita calcarea GSE-NOS-MK-12-04C TaxID=2839659 RepID=A0A951UWD6_9CYAN|nr:hypothetical protein [Cyanomargarita calcarea GSE-NOS-MK-12-04C]